MKKVLFLVVVLLCFHAQAQQIIKLDDVSKLTLITRGGGLSDEKSVLEVVSENKGWKCYQTRLIDHDNKGRRIDDSVRTFKRDVSVQTLQRLLDILARRDTGINRKLFKIDKPMLITFIDSLKVDFKPTQKTEFVDSLDSETVINTTLKKVLQPFLMDDRTYFGITIITNENRHVTIHAESFADLYNLPWHIDNIKSYDPNITAIFESISGFDSYPEYERKQLYSRMVREVYHKYFRTLFTWDSFKSDQPALFAILGNTFTPLVFYRENEKWFGTFRSALLPQYVQLRFWFEPNDTIAVRKIKRYEDTLVGVYNKNNFLFDYLKTTPGYTMELTPYKMEETGKYFFRDIKKYFDGIDKYDYNKSQYIIVYKGRKTVAKWILLPDNTLILISTIINDQEEPMNYNLQLSDSNSFPHNRAVCIVFNSAGKIIYNYGFAEGIADY